MKILAIDTATELCSAALLIGGTVMSREIETERGHAEQILTMADALLAAAGMKLRDADAIAFGRGPGAFTGVRLAASVTQGLAFGAHLPVIPISDLSAVAQRAFEIDPALQRVLVCNDARMREVYWACLERTPSGLASAIGAEQVGAPASVILPAEWHHSIDGAGRGFRFYPELAERLGTRLRRIHDDLLPRAVEIARLALPQLQAGRTVAPEQAIPVYLRDDVARPPSRD